MLAYLAIDQLALVDRARLEPKPGLNVLTGESGAGKSIVLDALAFVTGSTRLRCQVRAGRDFARVEAQFTTTEAERPAWTALLERHGLPFEDELVLARRVDKTGKTRCFLQGQLVPRTVLSEVSRKLVEFSDQGDSHELKSPAAQLELLDACLGLDADARATTEAFEQMKRLADEARAATRAADEAERRRDFLEFQLAELEEARVSEVGELLARSAEIDTSRRVHDVCHDLKLILTAGERPLLGRLDELGRRVRALDESGRELAVLVERAQDSLHELFLAGKRAENDSRFPEREAAEIDGLLERARDLARKHRVPTEELSARATELRVELEATTEARARAEELVAEAARAEEFALGLARALHEKRVAEAPGLARRVRVELDALGLEGARVGFTLRETTLGPLGISELETSYASHPTAQAAPLGRVASGGELGRVLLALRLSASGRRPLLVLDEIDAGSGGAAATRIGASLARAAELGQVLAVTHWPQVASRAAGHFVARKALESGVVTSTVQEVSGPERVHEIGRMLGGSESTALRHAEALLASKELRVEKNTGGTKRKKLRLVPSAA